MTTVIDLRGDPNVEALVEAIRRTCLHARFRCDTAEIAMALGFATDCVLHELNDADHTAFASAIAQALLRGAGIPIDPVNPTRH